MAAVSMFAAERSRLFLTYRVRLEFAGKLMGGVPKDPKIIEGWLRSKAGIDDTEEVRRGMLRTLTELGAQVSEGDSFEDLVAASEKLAAERSTCGFKRDGTGLYIEARQLKAAIKESVNILFAGGRWGTTKKGPKNYTAERLFVRGTDPEHPERIHLGITEPDGIELVIGHVSGPQGQRSTLGYHEYAERRAIEFLIDSTDAKAGAGSVEDSIDPEHWPLIWLHMEANGIGALRSQGHGQFATTAFERV
ncbi:hypothetical protein [Microcystis phage Mae-JY09]